MVQRILARIALALLLLGGTSGCVGMAIDATTDAAIAVGKVPFKVGGAVVDVATGDDEDEEDKDRERD